MDQLNFMMSERQLSFPMRQRLRSYFLANKMASIYNRQMHILDSLSPSLKGEVLYEVHVEYLAKIPFIRPFLQVKQTRWGFPGFTQRDTTDFTISLAQAMSLQVYAQREFFGKSGELYVLKRGIVTRACQSHNIKAEPWNTSRKVMRSGSCWGYDFMLSDARLKEPIESFALTYCESMQVGEQDLRAIIAAHKETCPEVESSVRKFVVRLAVRRAITYVGKKQVFRKRQAEAIRDEAQPRCLIDSLAEERRVMKSASSFV
jgi:hypothetical protein